MRYARIVALVASLGLLAGCGDSAPVKGPTLKPPQMPADMAQAEAEVADAMEAPFRYNPEEKRDPFRSFIRLVGFMDEEGVTAPLERFDLSQLLVTAIVWGNEEPRALVQDPSGKEYIVSEGTSIGKNKGKVVRIEDNLVLVKETYIDYRDRASTNEVEMRLYETHGG